jgi:hypothetical protein
MFIRPKKWPTLPQPSLDGFAKKLPKMPKGEKEKAFGPFNSKNMDGGASTKNESSKWEASKDEIHLVEQV